MLINLSKKLNCELEVMILGRWMPFFVLFQHLNNHNDTLTERPKMVVLATKAMIILMD